mmetsp:Transcript_8776/g.13134  ORF Transcript_8776/g.13134 Transcript_8776/m.13134 type:complete len:218 (-) Transcript_8776:1872-2525(-)
MEVVMVWNIRKKWRGCLNRYYEKKMKNCKINRNVMVVVVVAYVLLLKLIIVVIRMGIKWIKRIMLQMIRKRMTKRRNPRMMTTKIAIAATPSRTWTLTSTLTRITSPSSKNYVWKIHPLESKPWNSSLKSNTKSFSVPDAVSTSGSSAFVPAEVGTTVAAPLVIVMDTLHPHKHKLAEQHSANAPPVWQWVPGISAWAVSYRDTHGERKMPTISSHA